MANTVVITKLMDGPKDAMFHVTVQSDGLSGELTDQVIVDPATLYPGYKNKPLVTITELWYSLLGFDILLEFDSLVDVPVWIMSRAADSNYICFGDFGGLKDRSPALDSSGKLQITTQGLGSSALNVGAFVIKVRKD